MRRIMILSERLAVALGLLGILGLYLSGFGGGESHLKAWPVMLLVEAFGCSLISVYAAVRLAKSTPTEER